jgi:hypothetical protein
VELDLDLVLEAVGSRPTGWRPARGSGYTRSGAWQVDSAAGAVFAKQADDKGSLTMLRREALVYSSVSGPFLPAFVGFADSGDRAVLAIEYLSHAHWPPPYPEDVTPLFEALERTASAAPPADLPPHGPRESRWAPVAADPEPLLRLEVCTPGWLESSLDTLTAAEMEADFTGTALVHNDVYSGNVCFGARGALLIDWGAAVRGSRWIDVAFALLSIRAEGGIQPEIEFPSEAPFAAALSGHFAVEAAAPLPEWAEPGSTLRDDMAGDLRHALRWAAEALELAPVA